MKLLSFKHIFILGALLAAGSVQAHAADEVTGKSEELELTDRSFMIRWCWRMAN